MATGALADIVRCARSIEGAGSEAEVMYCAPTIEQMQRREPLPSVFVNAFATRCAGSHSTLSPRRSQVTTKPFR